MVTTQSPLVVLAVLDGWGIAPSGPGNAIAQASTPNLDKFVKNFPHMELAASGEAVGLPHGEAGNTEVGHINLGAGRIVYQDLTRINHSIADGEFFKNAELLAAINHAKKNSSNLHLMGLLGAGGVHSSIEHLYALVQLVAKEKFDRLFLHVFTDGRDSPARSALTFVKDLEQILSTSRVGKIATVMGRYWAMDRDRHWERTKRAYEAITKGTGVAIDDVGKSIEESYSRAVNDEFIEPSVVSKDGKPIALIKENDAVIFFNYRVDRPRQLSKAFLAENFKAAAAIQDFDPYAQKHEKKPGGSGVEVFERGAKVKNLYFVTMTEYSKYLVEDGAHVAFPREQVEDTLGEIIEKNGLKQLRISESEKERFVTYYFNGQNEKVSVGEERLIVSSPLVATYDEQPEMSAKIVTNALLEKLKENPPYSFILVNYANADMVGHSGNIGPTAKACEVVDECVGKLASFILSYNGTLLITADHGKAEEMINQHTRQVNTEHSVNPVPFIAISKQFEGKKDNLSSGILADVAPTILSLLRLKPSEKMTGRNLLENIA